eukprot:m.148198 g.148198  ORF g.148198 m.148198 type:complete len:777 (-) comp15055_c17_seq2:1648-3978(-)
MAFGATVESKFSDLAAAPAFHTKESLPGPSSLGLCSYVMMPGSTQPASANTSMIIGANESEELHAALQSLPEDLLTDEADESHILDHSTPVPPNMDIQEEDDFVFPNILPANKEHKEPLPFVGVQQPTQRLPLVNLVAPSSISTMSFQPSSVPAPRPQPQPFFFSRPAHPSPQQTQAQTQQPQQHTHYHPQQQQETQQQQQEHSSPLHQPSMSHLPSERTAPTTTVSPLDAYPLFPAPQPTAWAAHGARLEEQREQILRAALRRRVNELEEHQLREQEIHRTEISSLTQRLEAETTRANQTLADLQHTAQALQEAREECVQLQQALQGKAAELRQVTHERAQLQEEKRALDVAIDSLREEIYQLQRVSGNPQHVQQQIAALSLVHANETKKLVEKHQYELQQLQAQIDRHTLEMQQAQSVLDARDAALRDTEALIASKEEEIAALATHVQEVAVHLDTFSAATTANAQSAQDRAVLPAGLHAQLLEEIASLRQAMLTQSDSQLAAQLSELQLALSQREAQLQQAESECVEAKARYLDLSDRAATWREDAEAVLSIKQERDDLTKQCQQALEEIARLKRAIETLQHDLTARDDRAQEVARKQKMVFEMMRRTYSEAVARIQHDVAAHLAHTHTDLAAVVAEQGAREERVFLELQQYYTTVLSSSQSQRRQLPRPPAAAPHLYPGDTFAHPHTSPSPPHAQESSSVTTLPHPPTSTPPTLSPVPPTLSPAAAPAAVSAPAITVSTEILEEEEEEKPAREGKRKAEDDATPAAKHAHVS